MLRKMDRAWMGDKAGRGRTQMYMEIRICSDRCRRNMAAGVRQGITRRTVAARPRTTRDIADRIPRAIVLRTRARVGQVMATQARAGLVMGIRVLRLRDIWATG